MISLKTKNNLYRTKRFWTLRKWFNDKISFRFWSGTFKGNYYVNKNKNSFSLLRPTLLPFLGVVAYSIFVIFVFESYNHFFPSSIKFDSDAVNTFLAAIASVTGVFLGLYFTAIAGIASNFLLAASQDVRRFFLTAPEGVQYVQTVALTGVISVFYIFIKAFGHTIHPASLIFLGLLTAYIVIRFWKVGSAVFNSLEPTDSLPRITQAIADPIKAVVPKGFKWKNPAIQNHERKLAAYQLTLFDNLINFGLSSIKISNDQLIVAITYVSYFLAFYSQQKRKIPTNSFWYKTKNKFESWNFADSTAVSIALQTGTTLQPKTIKDFTWFEEQNLDIALKIFSSFKGDERINFLFQGFEKFVEIAELYGEDLDEAGIKLLFKKLDTLTPSVYGIKNKDLQDQSYKVQLAFVDTQGSLGVAALLGLSKFIREQSASKLSGLISKIDWLTDEGSIYLSGLPSGVVSRLESISSDLKNEIKIEGKILSPNWYIETLVVQRYLFCIQGYFNYVKSLHADYFKVKFEKLLAENQLPLAIQLVQRWREFTSKYSNMVFLLKKHVEELSSFHKVKDLPWVVFDFIKEQKEAGDREKEATGKMVELLPRLKDLGTGDDLPDYFGQALTMGVEACYEACEDNDPDRLKKIFPIVLNASLAAHEITRKKVADWGQEESKIIYSTEPLANLFEISGFAKLYSELYENPSLWKPVEEAWDTYLSTIDAKAGILFIAVISKYRDSIFKIMPQANLRAGWQIAFEHKLREHGFPVFPDSDAYNAHDKRPNHNSPLIRVLVRSGGISILSSPRDIFFATYLALKPAAEGIELPDKRDMQERIQKETENKDE